MSSLVLVRHGESTYNEQGLWTGWDNPPLTEKGKEQAKASGNKMKDISLDTAFATDLQRTHDTLAIILNTIAQDDVPVVHAPELKERHYGDYTKKNKWEVKDQIGEEEFRKLRRGWDYPIPNGESLKQVSDRVIPYYQESILPLLMEGKNVLICSSGNALRALIKYLEKLSDTDIADVEFELGDVRIYTIDKNGTVVSKEKR